MSTLDRPTQQSWSDRLCLPAYKYAEAARFAQTSASNVRRWYKGYRVPGHRMLPVFPSAPAELSYMQLVEVAFIATLRRSGVTLNRLRHAHAYLRDASRGDYPFAQLDLRTDGVHVLVDALGGGESDSVVVVADMHGQLVWTEAVRQRAEQFDYENGVALRWHPRGRDKVILIDPRIAFGAPVIEGKGIPTYAIRERYKAGEDMREIEDDFGISRRELVDVLDFEGVALAA